MCLPMFKVNARLTNSCRSKMCVCSVGWCICPKRLCELSSDPVHSTISNTPPVEQILPAVPQTTPDMWGYGAVANGMPSAHLQSHQPPHLTPMPITPSLLLPPPLSLPDSRCALWNPHGSSFFNARGVWHGY